MIIIEYNKNLKTLNKNKLYKGIFKGRNIIKIFIVFTFK